MNATGSNKPHADTDYWIGFGSNLGDREKNIKDALRKLGQHPQISITAISPIYSSEPVGPKDQPDFLNGVVGIKSNLTPTELLTLLNNLEKESGRIKTRHWGERTLDLDILLHNGQILKTESLTIPHPHMLERAFVLIPLNDIASNIIIPGNTEQTVAQALKECPKTKVWPYGNINPFQIKEEK